MEGHPYQYVVDYDSDIQAALDRLRAEVFRQGSHFGADRGPASPDAAAKMTGETQPDYCYVAPLTQQELTRSAIT